jgi:predicted RNA-binding Zn ribbon-like protein
VYLGITARLADQEVIKDLQGAYPSEDKDEGLELAARLLTRRLHYALAFNPEDSEHLIGEPLPAHLELKSGEYRVHWEFRADDDIFVAAQQLSQLAGDQVARLRLRACPACDTLFFDGTKRGHAAFCSARTCRRVRDRERQARFRQTKKNRKRKRHTKS